MNSLYFIIPMAVVFCALAIWAFFWAIDHGQFDDLENEGKRILFDEEPSPALSRAPLPEGEGLEQPANPAEQEPLSLRERGRGEGA